MESREEAEQQEYEEIIRLQTQKLREEFSKIDTDKNGKIDERELVAFLESKGKNIERESFNKLIKTLDIDSDGLITIEEFISSYVRIMGELRITINENEEKINQINESQKELEQKLSQYRGEKLNSEGLSSYSHILFKFQSIEINDTRLSSFDKVQAIISLGSFTQKLDSIRQEGKEFIFNNDLKM
jgi:hypothetical protein